MAGQIVFELLVLIGSMAAVATLLAGSGLLLRRAFTTSALDPDDVFLASWTGFGVVLVVLTCWHLAGPVGAPALAVVGVLATAGYVVNWAALRHLLQTRAWRPGPGGLVLLALVTLWFAVRASALPDAWDDGLYHVQAVKWSQAYAAVPGLANLHGPLGFNMPSFLFDAMIDAGPWAGVGLHVANPALLWLLAVQSLYGASRLLAGDTRPERLYESLMPAAPLVLAIRESPAGFSTDVPVLCLLMMTGLVLYRLLTLAERGSSADERYLSVAFAMIVAAAVQVKLSTAVYAGLSLIVALVARWPVWTTAERRQILLLTGGVAVACGVPWLVRAVVLSGYPLYPIPVAGLPVDWRVPLEHARVEAAYIGFTERGFSWHLVGSGWVQLVLVQEVYSALVPCVLAVLALRGAWPSVAGEGGHRRPAAWWAALPLLCALLAWLLSAPSTRYALPLFWSLAALCVAEWGRVELSRGRPGRVAKAALAAVTIACAGPLVEPALAAASRGASVAAAVGAQFAPLAGPPHGLRSAPPSFALEPFVTTSGLTLHVPARSAVDRPKCFAAPLPCTSNPAPNLRLREPGNMAAGFAVDGAWQMQDWPYYWQSEYLPEWRRRQGVTSRESERVSKP
ncbi:MAG: hypothetical protein U0Q55_04275 [Vicinamibacterales bacterium]